MIDKVMQVLGYLELHPEGETLAGLTRALGQPKTTLFRVVHSLEEHQMLSQTPEGRYVLGSRLLGLARNVARSMDLVTVSQAELEALSGRVGETSKLAIKSHEDALVVLVVPSPHGYGITTDVGKRFPLYAGAAGKVLLAFCADGTAQKVASDRLVPFTAATTTDGDALLRELDAIRSLGWAEDRGEYVEWIRAVAAPVFNAAGDVIAALSVPFVKTDDGAKAKRIRPEVVRTARAISEKLGASHPWKADAGPLEANERSEVTVATSSAHGGGS